AMRICCTAFPVSSFRDATMHVRPPPLPGHCTRPGPRRNSTWSPTPAMPSTSPAYWPSYWRRPTNSVDLEICMTMNITLNGQPLQVDKVSTIAELIAHLGYEGKRIAVEQNGDIVPKSTHGSTPVADGDQLEIVVAVGGG